VTRSVCLSLYPDSRASLTRSLGRRCWPSRAQVPVGDLGTLLGVEFLALAFVEAKRNEETDPVKRCYPGGAFDPMGMSSPANKVKEVKNGRLAMVRPLRVWPTSPLCSAPSRRAPVCPMEEQRVSAAF
jgi:hypothetical protein